MDWGEVVCRFMWCRFYSDPLKAIEIGLNALEILGYPIPFDPVKAAALAEKLSVRISRDPKVIAVCYF